MQHHEFLRAFSSVAAAVTAATSRPARALSPDGKASDIAVAGQPWFKPFKGVADQDPHRDAPAAARV